MLDDIRSEIWLKLWGNLTFNPISALSRATLVDICQFPPTRTLAAAMMAEAQAVGTKLGITFRVTIDKRIDGAARVGKHKTSMLQDIEAAREPEIEALVGSVVELGQLTGTPTPHIDSVYALVKLLAASIAAEVSGARLTRTRKRRTRRPRSTGGASGARRFPRRRDQSGIALSRYIAARRPVGRPKAPSHCEKIVSISPLTYTCVSARFTSRRSAESPRGSANA